MRGGHPYNCETPCTENHREQAAAQPSAYLDLSFPGARPSLFDSSPSLTAASPLTFLLGSLFTSVSFPSSQRISVLEKALSQGFQSCSGMNNHTFDPQTACHLLAKALSHFTHKQAPGLVSPPWILLFHLLLPLLAMLRRNVPFSPSHWSPSQSVFARVCHSLPPTKNCH